METRRFRSLVDMLCVQAARDPANPAIFRKVNGSFWAVSWEQFYADVNQTANVLVHSGVQPGDRVVQLSENRYEWVVADLAILAAQAVHVPIHAPLTGDQIAYQIRHSGAHLVLLSGSSQAQKLIQVAGQLPQLRYLSYDTCDEKIGDAKVARLEDCVAGLNAGDGCDRCGIARESLAWSSLATILYTSGTTGEPKGVMLTHGNLISNTTSTLQEFDANDAALRLNFLPLSHVFARTCDLYAWMATGTRLAIAESRESVLADCAMVHPTWLNGVPYFFDRVLRALRDAGLADEDNALRNLFGGEIRVCCAGGAALPPHVFDEYHRRGILLLEGYGLSESSPVITVSTPRHFRRGCVGRPISGVEVAIAADGEILTRGPHVMLGYYRNETATHETIRDGWLYTGDLGSIDEDGFLRITGRKKEILVTSGGKNIAPVHLESLLTQDPLILQALVIGDGRNYLTALIVPNLPALSEEIASRGIELMTHESILENAKVLELFAQCIQRRLCDVSPYEQVRRFTLLSRGFTIEQEEMTPKLSLRRKVIESHFADAIESMYSKAAGTNVE